jgi:hypothetical protein
MLEQSDTVLDELNDQTTFPRANPDSNDPAKPDLFSGSRFTKHCKQPKSLRECLDFAGGGLGKLRGVNFCFGREAHKAKVIQSPRQRVRAVRRWLLEEIPPSHALPPSDHKTNIFQCLAIQELA